MQLRFAIPLTILFSGLIFAVAFPLLQWKTLVDEGTEDGMAQSRAMALFASAQIETAYRNQQPHIARDVLNHLGSFPNVIDAALFDVSDQVLHATDFRLHGMELADTPFRNSFQRFALVRSSLESELAFQPEADAVVAFFPISLDPSLNKLKKPDVGIFALSLNLLPIRQQAGDILFQSSLLTCGFFFLLSLCLWLVINRRILQRLDILTGAIQSLSAGEYPRVALAGKDELSLFSLELDKIIQTLKEQYFKLQQSEEQFRTLIELAPEEIFIQSEGTIVYMNQAGLRLLGATAAEQIVGRKVLDIVHPDYHEKVKRRIQALNAGEVESVPTIEQKFLRLDGTSVDVEVVAARTSYAGNPAVQVFIRDVSEKLMLRLANEQASRLAAIGTLAAGVAHEINNPNSVIMHNMSAIRTVWEDLETLLTEHARTHREFTLGGIPYAELCDEMPQLLQDCIDSSQRIKRIVSDLKDFAKDGDKATGAEESLATIDLNELAETASRLVMNRIKTSTDHFSLDLSTEQPTSRGSFLRLEQVVINLLINACQALTSPTQAIRLVTRHDPEQQRNWIEVHDQGRGISEAHQQQILEPFFTTRREAGGTGLGLSISNAIVKEYGGHIEFSSLEGHGTCVRVVLPAFAEDNF